MSRSVRPSVGRISAVRPCTTWLRFSLVETCTVSAQLRSAASVTSVSGVAEAKLPPMPMNTLARPSRIARMASTVSIAVLARAGDAEPAVQCGQERLGHLLPDAHGAVALDVGVPAHRAHAGAGLADHAAHQQQVGDLADRRHRVPVLGQPHRPAEHRALARRSASRATRSSWAAVDAGRLDDGVEVDGAGLRARSRRNPRSARR